MIEEIAEELLKLFLDDPKKVEDKIYPNLPDDIRQIISWPLIDEKT